MSDLPDFKRHGYEVERRLGRNPEGGRLTWLAHSALRRDERAVIKQFRFASGDSSWSGFKAHDREILALRELKHPRIPAYVGSFETDDGFCLVQQFVDAPSLAERQSFELEELIGIARSVLEILEYLQDRVPPVIHRDVKPGNILVDGSGDAYLVDFGLARTTGGGPTLSSIAVGTPGFMPPEQLFGRPLSEASDLYGLGATLVCLACGRRPDQVGELVDNGFRFRVDELPASVPHGLRRWLTKMVEPEVADRFDDARGALQALGRAQEEPRRPITPKPTPKPTPRPVPRARPKPSPILRPIQSAPSKSSAGSMIAVWIALAAVLGGGGLLLTFGGEKKEESVSSKESVAAVATEPEPPAEPEWMSSGCGGIIKCYSDNGYMGPVTGRVESIVAADGTVEDTHVTTREDLPPAVERCLTEVLEGRVIPVDTAEEGRLYCEYSGNVMGGTVMISTSAGFVPGIDDEGGDEAGGVERATGSDASAATQGE